MARLHRIEPLAFQPLDKAAGTPFLQVCNRNQATDAVDQFGNFAELGQRLLDECGTAAPEKAIEGVTKISRAAMANDGACDMRTPHCPAGGFVQDAFEREVHSEPAEVLNHLLGPPHSIGPAALEERL
jgi:hypothetical protein